MIESSLVADAPPWRDVVCHPAWTPFLPLIERLPGNGFPDPAALEALLPPGTQTFTGHPLRFTPDDSLPERPGEGSFEREIAATGRISTRRGNLHDLCNALVWARFPRLKAMLNQRHLDALPDSRPGRRGPVRDAATLFDECGLVVFGPDRPALEALAAHDWKRLFGRMGEGWPNDLEVRMVGHANLEKLWTPYKAMTGHCLLLHATQPLEADELDAELARAWSPAGPIHGPADLCPLPFSGIPGWWRGAQDEDFYDDFGVFRPPREGRAVPPVLSAS